MEIMEDYDSGSDSDKELQIALQKGLLKPGLIKEIEAKPKVKHTNNVKGLTNALTQLQLKLPWIETLDLVCDPAPLAPELAEMMEIKKLESEDKNAALKDDVPYNDFTREMSFYRLGQAAVLEGLPKLKKLGIPTKRPDDYFAEMTKSDEHMHKVRTKLKVKENALIAREKARKMREQKKFGKKVQVQRILEKQSEKRKMLENIKKYQKGNLDNLDFLESKDEKKEIHPSGYKIDSSKKNKFKNAKNTKQDVKKDVYGYGGKKKGSKRNNFAVSEFKKKSKDQKKYSGMKQNKIKNSKLQSVMNRKKSKDMKNKRPGKNVRKQQKNKK